MRKVPEYIKIKVPVWANRWIFLLKYTPQNVAAAGIILKMRGIIYGTPPDDEVLAYLTGWIYEKISKKLKV